MVDAYTKTVLTAIAVALVAIAFENAAQPALAQTEFGAQKVAICDKSGLICADVSTSGVLAVENRGTSK